MLVGIFYYPTSPVGRSPQHLPYRPSIIQWKRCRGSLRPQILTSTGNPPPICEILNSSILFTDNKFRSNQLPGANTYLEFLEASIVPQIIFPPDFISSTTQSGSHGSIVLTPFHKHFTFISWCLLGTQIFKPCTDYILHMKPQRNYRKFKISAALQLYEV